MHSIPGLSRLAEALSRLWRGQMPLARAFWLYFIVGYFVFRILGAIVSWTAYNLAGREAAIPAALVFMVGYPIFAAIGVWRCANAHPFDRWPTAAAAAKIGIVFFLPAMIASSLGVRSLDQVLHVFAAA